MKLPVCDETHCMCSLAKPAFRAQPIIAHLSSILDKISGCARLAENDVLERDLPFADHVEVQLLVIRWRALHVQLIAGSPRGGQTVIHPWIHKLHAAAQPVRQFRPVTARPVIHLVGQIAESIDQSNELPAVAQPTAKISQRRHVSIGGVEMVGVGCQDQIARWGNLRSWGKGKLHSFRKLPPRHIGGCFSTIEQLNVLHAVREN